MGLDKIVYNTNDSDVSSQSWDFLRAQALQAKRDENQGYKPVEKELHIKILNFLQQH